MSRHSFHLVVTVAGKSFSTMGYGLDLPFLLRVVSTKLVTLSVYLNMNINAQQVILKSVYICVH